MPFPTKAIREQARRRVAQQVRAGAPCALCGQPIDLSLRYPHPQAFTVDHTIPTSRGGGHSLDQLRPAHNACNQARSNGPDGTLRTNSGALDR